MGGQNHTNGLTSRCRWVVTLQSCLQRATGFGNLTPQVQDVAADIHATVLPSQNNTLCDGKTDSNVE